MEYRDAWLFSTADGAALSDVCLQVYAAGAKAGDEPVATKLLHSSVLGSSSPGYFRPHIKQLMHQEEQNALYGPPHKRRRVVNFQSPRPPGSGPSSAKPDVQTRHAVTLDVTCCQGEPHAVAEAVFCHAYSGRLPEEPDHIIWMVWRAGSWEMVDTLHACITQLIALADSGQLTVQHVGVLDSLPALPWADNAALMAALVRLPVRLFARTRAVLTDEQLLAQFVELPLALLREWRASKSLVIDSQNTVAILLTAWYDHRLATGRAVPDEECQQLTSLLRLSHVTLSFHLQALQHLRWFIPDLPEQHAVVRAMECASNASGGKASKKVGVVPKQTHSVNHEQLEQLWTSKELILGEPFYYAGYMLELSLTLDLACAGAQLGQQPAEARAAIEQLGQQPAEAPAASAQPGQQPAEPPAASGQPGQQPGEAPAASGQPSTPGSNGQGGSHRAATATEPQPASTLQPGPSSSKKKKAGNPASSQHALQQPDQQAGAIVADGQQRPAELFMLGLLVRPSWPQALVSHGLNDKVANPCMGLEIKGSLGDLKFECFVKPCRDRRDGVRHVGNRAFASLSELQSFAGPSMPVVVRVSQAL